MIRRERRDGGEGEERDRDKKELSLQFEEEDKEHRHLPLLAVQLPQGTVFLLSSRLDSAVKRCSSEVLVSSGGAW